MVDDRRGVSHSRGDSRAGVGAAAEGVGNFALFMHGGGGGGDGGLRVGDDARDVAGGMGSDGALDARTSLCAELESENGKLFPASIRSSRSCSSSPSRRSVALLS